MSLTLDCLAKIPFFFGHKGDQASKDMLLRRWEYENGASSWNLGCRRSPNILILHGDYNLHLLEQTIASARLQTYRFESIVTYSFSSRVVCTIQPEEDRDVEGSSSTSLTDALGGNNNRWTVIVHAGELCNPSLAYSVMANAQNRDQVVYWNAITAKVEIGRLTPISYTKAPFVDLLLENRVECTSFAVRGDAKNKAIKSVLEGIQPATSVSTRPRIRINEFLIIKNIDNSIPPFAGMDSSKRTELLERKYRAPFEIINTRGLSIPLPKTKVASISAIVMYRDKPQETKKCIQSLISSSGNVALEIVLIDNNSSRSTKDQMNQMVDEFSDSAEFKCLTYANAFNHSAQLLLGIKHASSELIVLLNNDVVIQDPDVLMHSAKWAQCYNIASVGVLHQDQYGNNSGGPFKRRENVVDITNSLVEEYTEVPAGPFMSFGNTFAFTVMKKSIFYAISVDPFRFPNGYNDVDYCLRAHRSGYCHITLGYLSLVHLKGASRGKTDESCQKSLLRCRFSSFYLEQSELSESYNIKRALIRF